MAGDSQARVHQGVQPASFAVPRGHYSPGYQVGDLLFISGQLPIEQGKPANADMPFDEQVRVVMANIRGVLEAAGGTLNDIAKVNAYITDVSLWPEFNRVYAELMGDHRPARCVVPVPALNYGMKLEVEAVACLRAKG